MGEMGTAVIGFWGGMALLISSITGPGLTTIPLLFQEAGWFTPTLAFLLFGVISGAVSLFLIETMSTIHGNESFQARVEYSTVAHLYMGNKAHIVMQILLYCALQSVNVSSIIISEQTMDSLLIRLFHKTCALSFTEGWICVSEVDPAGSPFDTYILFSIGYLISAAMVLPLSMMSLVENIKFQLASVAALFFVMGSWVYIFAQHGLDIKVPVVGASQSTLVGFVLNNFAFITTIPSFVNELSRHVSIHMTIAYPLLICVALYLIVGLMGASSFQIVSSSDILATLSASNQNRVLITIVNILFPIAVLVTSVPVFAIVIRYNLVRGNFCSNRWAIVWASVVPWLLIIPFQTKGWLILVMNWTSLVFGSSTNFIIPLILYISSKTNSASTFDTTGGDLFVLHREDSSASSRRRSIHELRRSLDNLPRLVTPASENDPRSTYNVPISPLLVVYSPTVSRRGSLANENDPSKSSEDFDVSEARQEGSASSLDPSSLPLRVIYSPAVSRNGSVAQSDRPSIVLTQEDDPGNDMQILSPDDDDDSTQARSFQASSSEGNVYRRSRNNSNPSNMNGWVTEGRLSGTNPPPPPIRRSSSPSRAMGTPLARRSSSPGRRLGFEEASHRENGHVAPVFVAFPRAKLFKSILVAKITLGIVACCVTGNLIYSIVETARGNSPIST